jgi:calcium-dependent protein kinase
MCACLSDSSAAEHSLSCADIAKHVVFTSGTLPFTGRYHQEPKKLEDDYVVSGGVLGLGMNGNIKLAFSKSDPEQRFAVKTLYFNRDDQDGLAQVTTETKVHLCLDHPHIVRLYDVYESSQCLHLVMECMEGGELFERISAKGKFTEGESREVVYQMLLALNYMHSHGMVHRDVKLENMVYEKRDGDFLKLIDFGTSAVWSQHGGENLHLSCGTLHYSAPEVLNESYTSQCDLWSLGVVAFILLSGQMPFMGSSTRMQHDICSGNVPFMPEVWDDLSWQAKNFVQSLLSVDPAKRLTAVQALDHPWISAGRMHDQLDMTDVVHNLRSFADASKCRQSCMRLLALSLPAEERAKARDHFLTLATSKQGTLSLKDLRTFMMSQLDMVKENEILKVFRALDYNGDHEIHYSDFMIALMGSHLHDKQRALKSAFNRLDRFDLDCIKAMQLHEFFGDMVEVTAEGLVQEIDRQNHGHICFADFVEYLTRCPPQLEESPQLCFNTNPLYTVVQELEDALAKYRMSHDVQAIQAQLISKMSLILQPKHWAMLH